MPVIIERLLYNLSLASQYLINELKNNKIYNNAYGVIVDLPNIKKLNYVFIIGFIIFIMYNVSINLNHIFGLFIIIITISILIQRDNFNFRNYLDNKQIELDFLNSILFENKNDYLIGSKSNKYNLLGDNISYLYINPLIVTLLYKLRKYSEYSFSNYRDLIFHINNLLNIKSNIISKSNNNKQLFEIAYQEYRNSLNSFQSMIYSIPSTDATNIQYQNSLDILDQILLYDINEIKKIILQNNNTNVNINTIHESFFENFIIKPNQDINEFANKVYNFYI